jgi:N utilization substance protein B
VNAEQLHQARCLALQALCILDVQGDDAWPDARRFLADEPAAGDVRARAQELVEATWQRRADLDAAITRTAERWSLERMGLVDRNVLRLALIELRQPERTPPKVAIDEAIELARAYGTAESPAFVNGILDAIWQADSRSAASGDVDSSTPDVTP